MPYDYSDAQSPRDFSEPIPAGTVAAVSLHIRAGGAGEGGLLKRSKDGGCEMLDLEFVVMDGDYKGRKFWEYYVVEGGTNSGHKQAIDISRGVLKAIIDAVKGLDPKDTSEAARAARTVEYVWFEGATFLAKLGVEKGGPIKDKPGEFWSDKNTLLSVVTPGQKDWRGPLEQPPASPVSPAPTALNSNSGGAAAPLPPVERPSWA
jgi:hypothetical protein